jgi:putative flippase GtrA
VSEETRVGVGRKWKPLLRYTRVSVALNRVNRKHADEAARIATFLAIGGCVALVNLACVWLLSHQHLFPYFIYVTAATEFSILSSFFRNDRITFRHFTGGRHVWRIRCVRFHGAAAAGAVVTIGVSTMLYHGMQFGPVYAQCVAIVVATTINFAMHRFWTYRPRDLSISGVYVDVGIRNDETEWER